MFCHKCGNKIVDDASFCDKCGAKVEYVKDTALQTTPAASGEPKAGSITARPAQPPTHNVLLNTPQKKKSKKLPIILGIIALVIATVVFIVLNWEGKTDYEATVRAYTPYANSQGLPYTCGEVFDKYIPDAKWKIRQSGDAAYVDISGTAKGTNKKLIITMQVEVEDDRASINPVSIKMDDREASTKKEIEMAFFTFFVAYDEKYDDLSKFTELDSEIEAVLQGESSLTEIFTDKNTGISFRYPAGWELLDSFSEFQIVEMYDSMNTADHIAKFYVNIIFEQDPYGVFTGDEVTVREAVNEYVDFLDFSHTSIGDVPAKSLTYRTEGLKGDDIVTKFWYVIGNNVYQITCSYSESTSDNYEPIFNAIMDSYTITIASTTDGTASSGSDVFADVLNEYIGYINDGAYINCEYVLYDIDGNGVDELLVRYEDRVDGYTDLYTYVDGKTYKVGEFWSRNQLLLDEDGNCYSIGSNGASSSIFELARISSNGTELVTIEAWEVNGPIYTHITQNGVDAISESEFQDATDRFFNMTTDFIDSLNWQPLSALAGADNGTESAFEGQILYNGQPIVNLMSIEMEKLYDIFGTLIGGTSTLDYLTGTEYYSYDGIYFSGETGYVNYIRSDANRLIIDGATLDKDRDGIIKIFGQPILEEEVPGYEDEGFPDCYVMEYLLQEDTLVLRIELPDVNGKANSVTLSWYVP